MVKENKTNHGQGNGLPREKGPMFGANKQEYKTSINPKEATIKDEKSVLEASCRFQMIEESF